MIKKISIVVPAHNEEKRIGKMLDLYLDFFKHAKINGLDFEIIVVLNACKDKTKEIVLKKKEKNKELIILDFKQGGKGFAVLEGFKDALKRDSQAIGFVDADAATSPEAFYHLMMHLHGNDGVIASRYVPGAVMNPKPTLKRIIVSRLYNSVIRALFLFSFRDTQCGAKIFRRDSIKYIVDKIGMTKWAFDVELLYKLKKNGAKISEIPTNWSDREYSKINAFTAGPMMLLGVVRLRILNSPFSGLIRVYDFFAEFVRGRLKK